MNEGSVDSIFGTAETKEIRTKEDKSSFKNEKERVRWGLNIGFQNKIRLRTYLKYYE